jgi:putative addiction module component (TIGR02574 family)
MPVALAQPKPDDYTCGVATIALAEIRKLSVDERIQLVEDICDSVAADAAANAEIPITEAQRQELDARLADADAHPGAGTPWSEVKARLLGST